MTATLLQAAPRTIPPPQTAAEAVVRAVGAPEWWVNTCCQIKDEQAGAWIPFTLWPAQIRVLSRQPSNGCQHRLSLLSRHYRSEQQGQHRRRVARAHPIVELGSRAERRRPPRVERRRVGRVAAHRLRRNSVSSAVVHSGASCATKCPTPGSTS